MRALVTRVFGFRLSVDRATTAAIALATLVLSACSTSVRIAELAAMGDTHELRERDGDSPERSSRAPSFLIVAFDGVRRDVLYELLQDGALRGLESLLGGREGGKFPHAVLDRSMLAPFPSVTLVGWASIFTGEPAAASGITGNEFFLREERRFVAPIPSSFVAREPVLATITKGYANDLLRVPTLYERLRADDPDVSAWVSVSQFYRGADRLLIAQRAALIDMFAAATKDIANGQSYKVFEERDQEVLETVVEELDDDDRPVPDVLTLYVSGTDAYQHAAPEGPDAALRAFLTGKVDRMLGEVRTALARRGELANRYVVVVSDHGHSEVPHDRSTMLSAEKEDAPPEVLTSAGFRLRPLQLDVPENDDFQAVLAYQGPVACVYVADRSTCRSKGAACDWARPPRFRQDVVPAAEAFFQANRSGRHVPAMKGTLDMILTRRPRPFAEDDLPFEVYVGGGRLVPVKDYLRSHPHPTWVAVESRLRELAVGRYGERAGDIVLVARTGDAKSPKGRYYFSVGPQESVHGSFSRLDSEVPFVLAHPARGAEELKAFVGEVLGRSSRSRQVTDVILRLREAGAAGRLQASAAK